MTPRLTPRQAAVLAAAADGAPLSTVAARLGTTRTQVSSRLSEAYRALDVTWLPRAERRAEAVRIARRHGLIPADTQPDAAHSADAPRHGPTTALRAPHTPSRPHAPSKTANGAHSAVQPIPPQPNPGSTFCAHCQREIENRAEPTMGWPARDNWVHVPGAYTPCHPERGADSPHAEPSTN